MTSMGADHPTTVAACPAVAPGVGSPPPRVSVIIPHLNTPDMLARCLTSVVAQCLDHGTADVIVVDNGSRMSLDAVMAAFPGVRFLAEPRPGPGLARNRGIAAARAPLLAFIDADCRAAPGWLQAAVDALDGDEQTTVIGGDVKIDFVDPRHLTGIEAYEAVFGFRQKLYIEQKQFSVTANLAMAAPVHALVGPFAGIERAEDVDWGQRAHAAGHATRFVPSMLVYHPARPDFAALTRKWQRHVRHDYNDHVAMGRPLWRWFARAIALLASIPVESLKLLTSDKLSGLNNRCLGIGILARIRLFRAMEMARLTYTPSESGADFWNRHA